MNKGQLKLQDQHPILTTSFKNHLLESTVKANKNAHVPEKVTTRNESKLIMRDSKKMAVEKQKRNHEVQHGGFLSVPKEPYHPLGNPILPPDDLILAALNIEKQSTIKTNSQRNRVQNEIEYEQEQEERTGFDVKAQPPNGYTIIKEELRKSKNRWHSVKFGVPFEKAIQTQSNDAKSVVSNILQEKSSWPKIDPDKQSYFRNLIENHKRSQRLEEEKQHDAVQEGLEANKRSLKSQSIGDSTESLTKEELERELGIKTKHTSKNNLESFLAEREKIYSRRNLLTFMLEEDMRRLEIDRKTHFQRRLQNLEYKEKTLFVDTMTKMRRKAEELKKKDRARILQAHVWYKDMVEKLVLTGKRDGSSEIEHQLIEFIKGLIEDQVVFTKDVFVRLMRLVPKKDFIHDDIQRILRFIKQHESINERDYLDAIEIAGHSVV